MHQLSGGVILQLTIRFQHVIFFDFGIRRRHLCKECVKYRFHQKQHGLAVIIPFDLLQTLDLYETVTSVGLSNTMDYSLHLMLEK